jgi:hypothetical protein
MTIRFKVPAVLAGALGPRHELDAFLLTGEGERRQLAALRV